MRYIFKYITTQGGFGRWWWDTYSSILPHRGVLEDDDEIHIQVYYHTGGFWKMMMRYIFKYITTQGGFGRWWWDTYSSILPHRGGGGVEDDDEIHIQVYYHTGGFWKMMMRYIFKYITTQGGFGRWWWDTYSSILPHRGVLEDDDEIHIQVYYHTGGFWKMVMRYIFKYITTQGGFGRWWWDTYSSILPHRGVLEDDDEIHIQVYYHTGGFWKMVMRYIFKYITTQGGFGRWWWDTYSSIFPHRGVLEDDDEIHIQVYYHTGGFWKMMMRYIFKYITTQGVLEDDDEIHIQVYYHTGGGGGWKMMMRYIFKYITTQGGFGRWWWDTYSSILPHRGGGGGVEDDDEIHIQVYYHTGGFWKMMMRYIFKYITTQGGFGRWWWDTYSSILPHRGVLEDDDEIHIQVYYHTGGFWKMMMRYIFKYITTQGGFQMYL